MNARETDRIDVLTPRLSRTGHDLSRVEPDPGALHILPVRFDVLCIRIAQPERRPFGLELSELPDPAPETVRIETIDSRPVWCSTGAAGPTHPRRPFGRDPYFVAWRGRVLWVARARTLCVEADAEGPCVGPPWPLVPTEEHARAMVLWLGTETG
jgi:hypothetical protein